MELSDITFRGPEISAPASLAEFPEDLREILQELNGFVAFKGGFHFRGACDAPKWHSLADAMTGKNAIHKLFSAVQPTDIPFGQDCLGDQFLLRNNKVYRLSAEMGELESMDLDLPTFMENLEDDAIEFLDLQPLLQFESEGKELKPGQLISVYPPFVAEESEKGVTLRAIPATERILFLSQLAKEIADVPDGGTMDINADE